MKNTFWLLGCLGFLSSCCNNCGDENVVSQRYIHKYGFDISKADWEKREQDGQVIKTLDDGVTITQSYENSILHGPTTYSFPNSSIIEKVKVYDQGILLKEIIQNKAGMPVREEIFEFDDRVVLTLWDEKGAPMSIEEYEGDKLVEASYFSPKNEMEFCVQTAEGTRVRRDRQGQLLCKDTIENGYVVHRITYHPNGEVYSTSSFEDYFLHGEQLHYYADGTLSVKDIWNHGVLDGVKYVYQEGNIISETPYTMGKKEGVERHYNNSGMTIAEIHWKNDKRHGSSRFYSDHDTKIEWYYKDVAVNPEKFEVLENRSRMICDFLIEDF